jgi:hypothetical protein
LFKEISLILIFWISSSGNSSILNNALGKINAYTKTRFIDNYSDTTLTNNISIDSNSGTSDANGKDGLTVPAAFLTKNILKII